MSEQPLDYDPRDWHNVQAADEMDVSRYFEYDDDAILQLRKWLRLDQAAPKTMVEIGCGGGYFTGKLVAMASALSEIWAVEPDDVLREYASRKLSSQVKFLKGTAEKIPLPKEFADLTVCHIVLSNLPDVPRAVAEMTRVTKKDGIVATIEPGESRMHYSPDPELNEMEEKVLQAYGKGIWDLRTRLINFSKDLKNKNARYPEAFNNCGLRNVEAHGLLSVFLLSDPRRDAAEILGWLKKRVFLLERDWDRTKVILQRGGLEAHDIQAYFEAEKAYLHNLIQHPEQISKTHELQTYSRTITIGFK
jgi:ubiquinone/menaquinone biosynthesis C-methylase UbiE